MTDRIFTALLNGAILSVPAAGAVWAGLRLAPRRALGAAARYLVWWAALMATMLLPVAYLRMPAAPSGGAAAVSQAERVTGVATPAVSTPVARYASNSRTAHGASRAWARLFDSYVIDNNPPQRSIKFNLPLYFR